MTHMYGKDISIDISAQRVHDVNTFRQDRRWMYGVDLMPKLPEESSLDMFARIMREEGFIEIQPQIWQSKRSRNRAEQWEYM